MLELDELTQRRLLVAKRLLWAGEDRGRIEEDWSRVLAVIALDLAVETVIRAVVRTDPRTNPERMQFHELLRAANAVVDRVSRADLPYQAEATGLHNLRNLVQHDGRTPSSRDVSSGRMGAEVFIAELVRLVWGQVFADLTLTSLITDDRMRECCETATALVQQGLYHESMIPASFAMWTSMRSCRRVVMQLAEHEVLSQEQDRGGGKFQSELGDDLTLILAGISYPSFVEFRRLSAEWPSFTAGRGWRFFGRATWQVSAEDAEFVLRFVIDSILRLQAAFPAAERAVAGSPGPPEFWEVIVSEDVLRGKVPWPSKIVLTKPAPTKATPLG